MDLSGEAGFRTMEITTSLPPDAVLPPIALLNLKPRCAASLSSFSMVYVREGYRYNSI
jgi:hypothetical protein